MPIIYEVIIHIGLGFDDFEFKHLSHFSFDAAEEVARFWELKTSEADVNHILYQNGN